MGSLDNSFRVPTGCGFDSKGIAFRVLSRSRRRWVDNIQMDLLEIGWGGMGWISLAQDRDKWRALVNAVMVLRVP
jgi:hypothetical protein